MYGSVTMENKDKFLEIEEKKMKQDLEIRRS